VTAGRRNGAFSKWFGRVWLGHASHLLLFLDERRDRAYGLRLDAKETMLRLGLARLRLWRTAAMEQRDIDSSRSCQVVT
jgi:hypothetical protein